MQRPGGPDLPTPARQAVACASAGSRRPCRSLVLEGEFDLDTVPEIDRFLRRTSGRFYHQEHLVIDLRGDDASSTRASSASS